MEETQAKGYFLEEVVERLLRETRYTDVRKGRIRGRGADHQIDSYGVFSFSVPFVYPLRLLSEAKWYSRKVGLPVVRNFVGVLKDISENYFVAPQDADCPQVGERYQDCGAIFSMTDFTSDAQDYAWAQGIYLISFRGCWLLDHVQSLVRDAFRDYPCKSLNRHTISEIADCWEGIDVYGALGLLDGIYPVMLLASRPFQFDPIQPDEIVAGYEDEEDRAYKEDRREYEGSTLFTFRWRNNLFQFSVLNRTGDYLIKKIERTRAGKPFSYVDVPCRVDAPEGHGSYRRIYRVLLSLHSAKGKRKIARLRRD